MHMRAVGSAAAAHLRYRRHTGGQAGYVEAGRKEGIRAQGSTARKCTDGGSPGEPALETTRPPLLYSLEHISDEGDVEATAAREQVQGIHGWAL